MKLFTIDETISSILEETEGLDEEITDGIILRKKEISAIEIEKLKSKLEIEYLDSVFTEDILSYNWVIWVFSAISLDMEMKLALAG